MAWFYFWVLVLMLAAALMVTLLRPEKIYEYPYFMAGAFAVFMVPQAISLIRFPGVTEPEMIANVLFMACLCFAMCWLGYQRAPARVWQERLARPVDSERLFHGGLVFLGISYFFNFLIWRMTPEETGGGAWSGPVTIYGFFAGLVYPAFAICLRTAFRTGSVVAWLATVAAGLVPIQTTVLAGRRESTVQFLLTLALTLYYERKIKPPRLAIVSAVGLAMLAIPATGTYRGLAADRNWKGVRQMDLAGNFKEYVNGESILELRNAAMVIEGRRRGGEYELGKGYWDQLVFRFVPAQVLGKEFKDGLMFQPIEERLQGEVQGVGYDVPMGSTLTGLGDSFQEFGWFGCVFFGLMGMVFRTVFEAARRPKAVFAQLFYIQIATSGMRAVTHQTLDFLPGVVYYAIFLGALWVYAQGGGGLRVESEKAGRAVKVLRAGTSRGPGRGRPGVRRVR